MSRIDVGGATLSGAFAAWQGRDTLADNPFSDSPGTYVLHKAWHYGFLHFREVIEDHNAHDRPQEAAL